MVDRVNIFDRVVILSLTIRKIGDSGTGNLEEVQTEADKSYLRLKTKLMEFKEYEDLVTAANELRNSVKLRCFGGKTQTYTTPDGKKFRVGNGINRFVKSGCYAVTLGMVEKVQDIIDQGTANFYAALDKLCEVYEARRDEMLAKLKGQATEDDYPTVEKIRKACKVEYGFITVGTPPTLEGINRDIYERESAKLQAQMADASEEMRMIPRLIMKELVDHMLDRIKPGEDGKKKRFAETSVTKMKQFLEDFEGKNVTNDQELAALVEQARSLLAGKEADDYRKDDAFRDAVSKGLEQMKKEIDGMVQDVPERAVMIDD